MGPYTEDGFPVCNAGIVDQHAGVAMDPSHVGTDLLHFLVVGYVQGIEVHARHYPMSASAVNRNNHVQDLSALLHLPVRGDAVA